MTLQEKTWKMLNCLNFSVNKTIGSTWTMRGESNYALREHTNVLEVT